MRLPFHIESVANHGQARAGHLQTLHGGVPTPVFMPVGTQATVKSQTPELLHSAGTQVLLANTYHLMLRPGVEVFQRFGGIHRFMQWPGPILTDSGGFQIFSLPNARKITEQGAWFQSYVDGRTHLLSPERSIEVQKAIGSDIMMVLDECIPSTADTPTAQAAMERTHRWAMRSLEARGDSPQALFAIVQGACNSELRKQSADFLTQLPFDGFAIGGLAVGETKEQREHIAALTTERLPQHRPRYLMGVGTPLDILEAVYRGVDMFDCILPSQLAQRGGVYTSQGRLQLRRTRYKFADEPVDPQCPCPTCQRYSRAYLHHLTKAGETLGWILLTHHNLSFYHRLMAQIRVSLLEGTFEPFYREYRTRLALSDNTHPGPSQGRLKRSRGEQGDFEVITAEAGIGCVRQKSSGETMHSRSNPLEEAHSLYVDQSDLAARLEQANATPLVIWDVGLGAATNAMAAVQCIENTRPQAGESNRAVHIVSFETTLDPLRLALQNPALFPQVRHPAPHSIAKTGTWTRAGILWTLIQGDFAQTLHQAPTPELIFYDPFSLNSAPELWDPSLFESLFQHCADQPAQLYTYSASTAVRSSLLASGFFVAVGRGTGQKHQTTIAYNRWPVEQAQLLGSDWVLQWNKSSAKYPAGLAMAEREVFEFKIRNHPQFRGPETAMTAPKKPEKTLPL